MILGNSMIERFIRNVLRPVSRGVTAFVAVYTVAWGIWLLAPEWSVFTSAPLYSGLSSVAPEWAWGLLAVICGVISLVTAVEIKLTKTTFVAAAVTGWHWFLVSILYFYGDWHNTGGITALFLAFLCAYIYLNVRQNGGYH